jgi:hypothetical protein
MARTLSVDRFHIEANAAWASLRASLKLVAAPDEDEDEDEDGEEPAESGVHWAECEPSGAPQLSLVAPPGSGSAPKRKSSTSVSLSDPDSKLRHKPGQRPHRVHPSRRRPAKSGDSARSLPLPLSRDSLPAGL